MDNTYINNKLVIEWLISSYSDIVVLDNIVNEDILEDLNS